MAGVKEWLSFLLSLGGDVWTTMNMPNQAAPPPQPNILQLHRATMQVRWPMNLSDGRAMPAPAIFGDTKWGSRILVRDDYYGLMLKFHWH